MNNAIIKRRDVFVNLYNATNVSLQLEECVWTGCVYPPHNPSSSNTQPKAKYGEVFAIGDLVEYECFPGFSSDEDELAGPGFSAECALDGAWILPTTVTACAYAMGKFEVLGRLRKVLNVLYL